MFLPVIDDVKKERTTQSQKKAYSHHDSQSLKFKSQEQQKLPLIGNKFKQIDYNLSIKYKQEEAQKLKVKMKEQVLYLKNIQQEYLQADNFLNHFKNKNGPQIQRLGQRVYENNLKINRLLRKKKSLLQQNQVITENMQIQIQQLQGEIDYLSKITADKQHQLVLLKKDIRLAETNKQSLGKQISTVNQNIQHYRKQLSILSGNKISKFYH